MEPELVDKYDTFSPVDYRYPVRDLEQYLSENAYTRYLAMVEAALVETLADYGVCPREAAEQAKKAASMVTAREVYQEEARIRHDIRALVNVMKTKTSQEAGRWIHLGATSYDIIETANAKRYRDAMHDVILPDMIALEKELIKLARREKDTPQIMRTHGQHAVPGTFGLSIAKYVDRWGDRILYLENATNNLKGKLSGAVGAYNAISLIFDNPEEFEKRVLEKLGLEPARLSTQIAPPEYRLDLFHGVTSAYGVLASYARDIRNLSRTEIDEASEPFGKKQVGSSTMPHKKNPINSENTEGAWKLVLPQVLTRYMDQVTEHQRDLTDSITRRFDPELLVMFDGSVRRMARVTRGLVVKHENLEKNLEKSRDYLVAEPLYILLAFHGHPDAHEKSRQLAMRAREAGESVLELARRDPDTAGYVEKFTPEQELVLKDPVTYYRGIASQKTQKICDHWEEQIGLLEERLGL